jgi:DNA ligase-1
MKPMLAVEAPKELKFPVYASPKLDGIRAVVRDGLLLSRSLKPIPNEFVQDSLGCDALNGLDGELTVGPANHPNVMQATTSGVMSHEGTPDFTFWVFDYWTQPTVPFHRRLEELTLGLSTGILDAFTRVKLLPQTLILNAATFQLYEEQIVAAGFEGVMVRSVDGTYKYGRSTAREGYLLKVKRFKDAEAVVIGFEERMHNANEAKVNALGHTERSSHKANLIPMNTLGALVVRDRKTGVEFSIGTGFDDAARARYWAVRDSLIGQLVTYKFFEVGVKVAPRFPVFKGFRSAMDL